MYEATAQTLGVSVGAVNTIILILGLWEIAWKGVAMWYSAIKKQKIWFLAVLIFNTVGILPIIYLLIHKPWVKGKTVDKKVIKKGNK